MVCVNSLGSCKGSTGPASINPDTGALYRLDFPELSVEDGANAAFHVVRALGIEQLACIIGNSMGGMTALAYLLLHPGAARTHINISGSAQALPFSIAIRSLQREAIRLDPNWNGGQYDDDTYPESGMRMARKLGVITYRSALEWDGRFGRVRLESDRPDEEPFGLEFQVESYLEGHARRFVRRFDPNCYLYLSRSMDWFDLAEYADGDVEKGLAKIRVQRALAIGAPPTSCSRCNSSSRSRKGWRPAGRRRSSCRWNRLRATTPSWWISGDSGRRWRSSWAVSDACISLLPLGGEKVPGEPAPSLIRGRMRGALRAERPHADDRRMLAVDVGVSIASPLAPHPPSAPLSLADLPD